jgi:hypothetical protein
MVVESHHGRRFRGGRLWRFPSRLGRLRAFPVLLALPKQPGQRWRQAGLIPRRRRGIRFLHVEDDRKMKLLYPFSRSTLAQACRILNLLFVLGCGGCMTHEAMQIGRRTTVIHSPERLAESEAGDLILRCEVTVRDPENDVRGRLGNRYVVVPHTVANEILPRQLHLGRR